MADFSCLSVPAADPTGAARCRGSGPVTGRGTARMDSRAGEN
jgi:hypothetical protein